MVEIPKVESWGHIDGFNKMYMISSEGRVYDRIRDRLVAVTQNNYGHMRVNLNNPKTKKRETKSIRRLMAETFLKPPNYMCTEVAVLDGDFSNMVTDNLAWRPRWFVWKYTHQLREVPPDRYVNFKVRNVTTGKDYGSVVEAAVDNGELYEDVYRSAYSQAETFPHGHIYEFA